MTVSLASSLINIWHTICSHENWASSWFLLLQWSEIYIPILLQLFCKTLYFNAYGSHMSVDRFPLRSAKFADHLLIDEYVWLYQPRATLVSSLKNSNFHYSSSIKSNFEKIRLHIRWQKETRECVEKMLRDPGRTSFGMVQTRQLEIPTVTLNAMKNGCLW